MPFPFRYVCDLLERLQEIWARDPPLLPKEAERTSREVIERWFTNQRRRIENGTDGLALLSTLLPEKRPDRVYMLQANKLEKIIGRALALPSSRRIDLERWRHPGAGDLGDCVERVQRQGETVTLARAEDISIEHIDSALLAVASRSRFSSRGIRSSRKADAERVRDHMNDLCFIFPRLQARESKWLTRLILKSYAPIVIPAGLVYRLYHPLLPGLLKVQNELLAALHLLASLRLDVSMPSSCDAHRSQLDILKSLRPLVGVKVGRPPFFQGRGIKNCVDMARNRRMSVEKKYDGEYFQLHIDMSRTGRNRIKIFSKNGRDSTEDRIAAHSIVRRCLGLDEPNCKISTMCILEGELLVYSDKDSKIMDFHEIRKHVSRSGSFVGVHMDSPPHHYEHLMLMFFDILALDEEQVVGLKQHERRRLLEGVIRCIPGRAELAEYQVIRFSSPGAARELRNVFAKCIAERGEGLVMKPADEPYFNFENSWALQSCYIKLKKEAIGTFGDVGDFAIVGAAYDPVKAKYYRIPSLQWTDFYIGCLDNKNDILKADAKPRFVVVTALSLSQQIMEALVHTVHIMPLPYENTDHFDLRIESGVNRGRKPSVIFINPPVVDIRCFAFDKEGNTGFWTMRFPAVTKLHTDRTFLDTITFTELQQMAGTHKQIPEDEAEEERRWIKLLEDAEPQSMVVDASIQHTSSTAPNTPSPRRRLQEDSSRRTLLIREDTAEKQGQILRGDILNKENHLTIDQVPSLVDSAKLPLVVDEYQSKHLVSQAAGHSKRAREDILEDSVRYLKRQKLPESSKISYLQSPAADKSSISLATLSRPLSEIRNFSSNKGTSSELGKKLSATDKSNTKTNSISEGKLTGRKSHLTTGSLCPTLAQNDRSWITPRGIHVEEKGLLPLLVQGNVLRTSIPKAANVSNGNGVCQQAATSCLFINCSFLLTPSVAQMSRLAEDLLPSHGARFILDPGLWLDSGSFSQERACTGPKVRKVALVESKRVQETVQIFKAIQSLNFVRSDGKREWVEVYDFRIIECVSNMEMGKQMAYNIWRHFWIGAA